MDPRWKGLRDAARAQLTQRDYSKPSPAERLATSGLEVGEILAAHPAELTPAWIPGVRLFPRTVYAQRHRGLFGELARRDEGALAEIGFWPAQWASAHMYAGTAKGFHIHPPYVPAGTEPSAWFRKLYIEEPERYELRPYALEQWDVMFFLSGHTEMLLVDEREGMERRVMRFLVDGDNHRGKNNAGLIIPPGVAHALRAEGPENVVMVYGTSTKFDPANEGRIASGIECAPLPADWTEYFGG